jgi:hypothetical protein
MEIDMNRQASQLEPPGLADAVVLAQHRAQFFTQRLLSLPSNFALSLATLPWVEEHWLEPRYQAALDRHCPDLASERQVVAAGGGGSSLDQRIVNDLLHHGISVTHLDRLELPGRDRFWDQAQAIAGELAELAQQPGYRQRHTLNASADQLLRYPEVVWLGASERLLAIIEQYLGLAVAYDGPSFYYSLANPQTGGPRRWHRDKEDWRMIKVAIYLNDVDENGGPYEFMKPESNAVLRRRVSPYQTFRDREIEPFLDHPLADSHISCFGQAGTVILSDTAHYYHRGRPPVTRDRAAIFFSYFSQRPKHPFFCSRSALSDSQIRTIAAPLTDRQRRAMLWKDRLPLHQRFIPRNCVKV